MAPPESCCHLAVTMIEGGGISGSESGPEEPLVLEEPAPCSPTPTALSTKSRKRRPDLDGDENSDGDYSSSVELTCVGCDGSSKDSFVMSCVKFEIMSAVLFHAALAQKMALIWLRFLTVYFLGPLVSAAPGSRFFCTAVRTRRSMSEAQKTGSLSETISTSQLAMRYLGFGFWFLVSGAVGGEHISNRLTFAM